jgi:hypothetical protein
MTGLTFAGQEDAEKMFIRQHAYLLAFGITKEDMRTTYIENYHVLLAKSKAREERHAQNPDECDCFGKSIYETVNLCETNLQIKKDVPRTTTIFSQTNRKHMALIPMESGENPIFNILVAYSEFDQEVSYT